MHTREIWKILDIDPGTDDVRLVKRAYARKLKQTDSQEDPEAFMRLREAYEIALSITRQVNYSQVSFEGLHETPISEAQDQDEAWPQPNTEHEKQTDRYSFNPIDVAFELFSNPNAYDSISDWENLFDHPSVVSIDGYIEFEWGLMNAMLQWRGYGGEGPPQIDRIPENVLRLIFNQFDWYDETGIKSTEQKNALMWLWKDSGLGVRSVARPSMAARQPAPADGGGANWGGIFFIIMCVIAFSRFAFTLGDNTPSHPNPSVFNEDILPLPSTSVYDREEIRKAFQAQEDCKKTPGKLCLSLAEQLKVNRAAIEWPDVNQPNLLVPKSELEKQLEEIRNMRGTLDDEEP